MGSFASGPKSFRRMIGKTRCRSLGEDAIRVCETMLLTVFRDYPAIPSMLTRIWTLYPIELVRWFKRYGFSVTDATAPSAEDRFGGFRYIPVRFDAVELCIIFDAEWSDDTFDIWIASIRMVVIFSNVLVRRIDPLRGNNNMILCDGWVRG